MQISFRFNNFHTVNRCKFMSLKQKIAQVIALSCLISGAIIGLNNEVASARSILFERCHGHYCLEIKSVKKTFLKNGPNGKLYSIKVLRRDYDDGTISGRISKGKFRISNIPQYIYCSTSKPAHIWKYRNKNKYRANILNPGGLTYGFNITSNVLYWNTCHNYNPSGDDLFSMERRAKRLGYRLNLESNQIDLKSNKYDGISLGNNRRVRVGKSSVCTQDRYGSLNLRTAPGLNYRVISRIPNGGAVRILRSRGNWARIRYRGSIGWVSNDFLC